MSAGAITVLLSSSAGAQDAVLAQMYGSGVHAYFAGDYQKAYQDLTAVIRQGSRDPRCYYYRGLTFLNLGRAADARLDFAKGAELEAMAQDEFYDVSKALERIQGHARLELESYRSGARMAALERAEKIRKARYEEFRAEQRRVLLRPADEATAPPATSPANRSNNLTADDPFTTGPIDERTAVEAAVSAPPVAVPNAPLAVNPPQKANAPKPPEAPQAPVAAKKPERSRPPAAASSKPSSGSRRWRSPPAEEEPPAGKPAKETDILLPDKPAPARKPAAKRTPLMRRPVAKAKQLDEDNPFSQ